MSVAHDYLEAEYERDWQNAWALMCRDARNNFGDLPEFSQRLTEIRERYPSEVQVEISGVRSRTDRADPGVNVAYTITSSERRHQNWADRWDIDVVRENGQFRVCYGGG